MYRTRIAASAVIGGLGQWSHIITRHLLPFPGAIENFPSIEASWLVALLPPYNGELSTSTVILVQRDPAVAF